MKGLPAPRGNRFRQGQIIACCTTGVPPAQHLHYEFTAIGQSGGG